jgi:hypothetical protein
VYRVNMGRRLLNFVTAVSVLLLVGVVVLWSRFAVRWDIVHVRLPAHVVYLSSDGSGLMVGWWPRAVHDIFAGERSALKHESLTVSERDKQRRLFVTPYVWWRFAGFSGMRRPKDLPSAQAVRVPLWFPLVAAGVLPAAKLRSLARRHRRQRRGQCPACGYDLRATPGRCPECGTPAGGALRGKRDGIRGRPRDRAASGRRSTRRRGRPNEFGQSGPIEGGTAGGADSGPNGCQCRSGRPPPDRFHGSFSRWVASLPLVVVPNTCTSASRPPCLGTATTSTPRSGMKMEFLAPSAVRRFGSAR